MSESDDGLSRARLAIDTAIKALTEYRDALEGIQPRTEAVSRRIVQTVGLLTTTLVDELTSVYVRDGRDSDDLLDQAEAIVEQLGAAPAGFATSIDPEYHARMKRSTAIMLARLWSTGRLLGAVPVEVWPSAELARLLLPAVEEYADTISLAYELDRLDDDS